LLGVIINCTDHKIGLLKTNRKTNIKDKTMKPKNKTNHCKTQNYFFRFVNLGVTVVFVTNSVFGAETLGPCKVQIPVPSYGGYCQCETDQRNGDGICVKANMKWDAYNKCGGLTDPNKEIGKTICVPNNKRYGREIICTRETNWANLATFLGTGIGTGATIGAALASPTGPFVAAGAAVGGAVGGVAVMIGSFGCPVRTCTMTDGAERDVLAVGIFSGQDCYHKDPVQNPVR
jgi:hypothetical protein